MFPFQVERFASNNKALTEDDVERIQQNMSNCARPERGREYKKDSVDSSPAEKPDPFGIDHENTRSMEHTAQ